MTSQTSIATPCECDLTDDHGEAALLRRRLALLEKGAAGTGDALGGSGTRNADHGETCAADASLTQVKRSLLVGGDLISRSALISRLELAVTDAVFANAAIPAPAEAGLREAFEAGAMSVHQEWVRAHGAGEGPPRGDPAFSEAASDYAAIATQSAVQEPVAAAPERIWAWEIDNDGWWDTDKPEWVEASTEYIRADLAHEAITTAEMEACASFSAGYEAGERDGKASALTAPVEAGLREAVRNHLSWMDAYLCVEDEVRSSTPRKVFQNSKDAAAILRAALVGEMR